LPAALVTKEAKRPTHAAAIASLTNTDIRTVRNQQRNRVPRLGTDTTHGFESSNRLACIAAVRTDVGKEGPVLELTALLTACPSHDLRRGVERERVPREPNGALHNDSTAPRSAPLAHPVSIERGAEDHLGDVA